MGRIFNPATIDELSEDSVKLNHLIYLDLDSKIYLTDASHDIFYDGDYYVSSGHFLDIQAINEASEFKVGTTRLKFSGVEQSLISAFLQSGYVARQIKIYRVILNKDNSDIIGDPILIYDGKIDGYNIKDSANTSTIEVDIASHWSDFERKSGRVTNTNSQSLHFTGDKGFDFAGNVVKDILWGRD